MLMGTVRLDRCATFAHATHDDWFKADQTRTRHDLQHQIRYGVPKRRVEPTFFFAFSNKLQLIQRGCIYPYY